MNFNIGHISRAFSPEWYWNTIITYFQKVVGS